MKQMLIILALIMLGGSITAKDEQSKWTVSPLAVTRELDKTVSMATVEVGAKPEQTIRPHQKLPTSLRVGFFQKFTLILIFVDSSDYAGVVEGWVPVAYRIGASDIIESEWFIHEALTSTMDGNPDTPTYRLIQCPKGEVAEIFAGLMNELDFSIRTTWADGTVWPSIFETTHFRYTFENNEDIQNVFNPETVQ